MGQTTKEFLIKTVYDDAGLSRFENDCNHAKLAAGQLGLAFSDAAKVIDQSISTSVNKSGQVVRNVTSILEEHGKTARVTFQQVGGAVQAVGGNFTSFRNITAGLGEEFTKLISRAILVVPVWEALRFGLKSLESTFTEAIKFMIDWEDQMAHIRAVTNATKGELDILSQGILQMSATFGISNKDLAENANLWLRTGASISTVLPLLEASAKLSLLSGQSLEDSSKALNAIGAAYRLTATETANTVDKLTAVEEKSGVSLDVLTTAMTKASATAHGAGISFDELAGYITAINSTTKQSGDLIGSELRSIFLRLGTTAVDTAQSISKVPFFLDELGNVTTQHTPKLRQLSTIITELSLSFNKLSNAQQDQLAKAVGGNLRANAVTALFSGFDASIKAQAESSFGLKDANEAISTLTDTAKNHIVQLQGAWGQLVDTFSATGAIKGGLDIVKNSIEAISSFLSPEKFSLNKALEGTTKAQEDAGRALNQNTNLLKTIDQLHELNSIFSKDLPGSIDKSVLVAATFRKAFEDAGIKIKGTFRDSFDLEKVLGSQKNDFLTKAIDASLGSKKEEIQKAFIENSKELFTILDSNQSAFRKPQESLQNGQGEFIDDIFQKLTKLQGLTAQDVLFIKSNLLPGLSGEQGQALNQVIDQLVGKEKSLADVDKQRADIMKDILDHQKQQTSYIATQEEVQQGLKDIQEKGTLLEQDKLVTVQQQLDYLAKSNIEGNKTLQNQEDSLIAEKDKLLVARELLNINLQQSEVMAKLKADGASQLQLDIQQLAFLKAQANPDQDKVAKAQTKVDISAYDQQRAIQEQIIAVIAEKQKSEGETSIQILNGKIQLEDQLGIHKQGIDLLKEQLDLYKAITAESSKSKKERLDELQALIQKTPRENPFGGNGFADSSRESNLRNRASQRGISSSTVDSILNPAKGVDGGESGLLDQLKRGLSDPLGGDVIKLSQSIDRLADGIVRDQQRGPLSDDFARFKSPDTGNVTTGQRNTPAPTGPGGSPHSGNHTTVDIGGIQVTVQGSSPEEIAKKIGDITAEMVAAHLVKPGTKINNATKKVIDNF